MRYKIADIIIEIIADPAVNLALLSIYQFDFEGKPHSKIYIRGCNEIKVEEDELLLDDDHKWYRTGSEGTMVCLNDQQTNETLFRLDSNKTWENVTILFLQSVKGIESFIAEHTCYIVFRILILFHQGILLHSSSFIWNGKGVVVTAPSGTGKSTHVSLWEKYYKAKVLNDDSPAIKMNGDKLVVYGIPWSGSTMKFVNASAPLTNIIVLEQAPENSIRRIDKEEATFKLMPRFILPYFDGSLMNSAVDMISEIIEKTPVYLLRCRPDKGAADLVAAAIR